MGRLLTNFLLFLILFVVVSVGLLFLVPYLGFDLKFSKPTTIHEAYSYISGNNCAWGTPVTFKKYCNYANSMIQQETLNETEQLLKDSQLLWLVNKSINDKVDCSRDNSNVVCIAITKRTQEMFKQKYPEINIYPETLQHVLLKRKKYNDDKLKKESVDNLLSEAKKVSKKNYLE